MGDNAASGDGVELLCYFLHRYLDFRLPEVTSLAEMAGAGGQIAWCVAPHGTCHFSLGGCALSSASASRLWRRAPRS